ncbi:MAG TPA: MFS transporter [Woeseiaceae bacterium]|nr:MFS transporter [Woeseiaceae bacterium]
MSAPEQRQYPSRRYAWYMVVLLMLAYILSFVDRYVLGLLVEPIKADLGLTDTDMGWLLGLSFAIFYATMGIPLGYLADRKRRTWLITAGITVWSVSTFASGLARNFWHLFSARMMIGAGEATLSPCAISMISDSFPQEKRGKPIAFYTAALGIGAGVASLVGAGVLSWAKSVPEISVPVIGVVAPWQFTFFMVGTPGLLMGLLFMFMREPVRHVENKGHEGESFVDSLRYIWKRRATYLSYVGPMCISTIIAYSWGWFAAMFERTWGWEPEAFALAFGFMTLFLGPVSVMSAGWLNDRLFAAGKEDAAMRIMIIAVSVQVPMAILTPLMPTPEIALAVMGVAIIGNAMTSAVAPTGLVHITPSGYRGLIIAMYYMMISLTGLILGPGTIGLLSDHVFGNEHLNYSTAAAPAIFGIPVLLSLPYALRRFRRELTLRAAMQAT